jgi:hypothetical protein
MLSKSTLSGGRIITVFVLLVVFFISGIPGSMLYATENKLSIELPEIYITARDLNKKVNLQKERRFEKSTSYRKTYATQIHEETVSLNKLVSFFPLKTRSYFTGLKGEIGFGDHIDLSIDQAYHFNDVPYMLDFRWINSKSVYQDILFNNMSVDLLAGIKPSLPIKFEYEMLDVSSNELVFYGFGLGLAHNAFDLDHDLYASTSLLNASSFGGNSAFTGSMFRLDDRVSSVNILGFSELDIGVSLINDISGLVIESSFMLGAPTDKLAFGFSSWSSRFMFNLTYQPDVSFLDKTVSVDIYAESQRYTPRNYFSEGFIELSSYQPQNRPIGVSFLKPAAFLLFDSAIDLSFDLALYGNYLSLYDHDNDGYLSYQSMGTLVRAIVGFSFLNKKVGDWTLSALAQVPYYSSTVYNPNDLALKLSVSNTRLAMPIDISLVYYYPESISSSDNLSGYADMALNVDFKDLPVNRAYVKVDNIFSGGRQIFGSVSQAGTRLDVGVEINLY